MDPGREPCTYNMAFLTVRVSRNCPIKGCRGKVMMRTEMWVHFYHRHVQDTVIILEDVNLPHPRWGN